MHPILDKHTVLVLNRNWQAISARTPADAFCRMATDVVTALDIRDDGTMIPTKWVDWKRLPVRENDSGIGTARGRIRVPTVVVLARFAKVPMKKPKFNARNLWERDSGRCQYTGRHLRPGEGNIDHIVPRSRGGATTWENCVLASREVNSRKANRTPEEAGLQLLGSPRAPRDLPATLLLRNIHGIRDWDLFLKS